MPEVPQEHYRNIRRVLFYTLCLNWSVTLAKIVYGLSSRSESMTADGFHSLADSASNIIGLIGIHFAAQPKDQDHPYGHRKYETLSSLGIAVLLFVIAFNLAKEGLLHLRQPTVPRVDGTSFAVMLTTILVNFAVMRYERRQGQALKSDILISDALHTRSDILTSLSVVIALIAVKSGYPLLDPLAAILISLFIVYAGIKIIRQAQAVLCDSAVILDEKKIGNIVLGVKGVKACHKIRTRGRSDDVHLDLHVQVNADMHMDTAHKICYAIEEAIKKNLPEVTDVVVHMEPKD
jgi:cation diffusion facilitator family transporter